MSRVSSTSAGFTLVEIMIVISMIAILLSIGLFPYSYYMERARVEKTVDKISQEWIIAHQNIRGWLLHEGSGSHAHMYVDMRVGDWFVTFSTSTGGTSTKKEYKKYTFDSTIEILWFSGGIDPNSTSLTYHITPPFATGAFSTGSTLESYITGAIMTVWYPGATPESRRSRDILLRQYFD